jgi:hypothetical protein
MVFLWVNDRGQEYVVGRFGHCGSLTNMDIENDRAD